MTLKIAAWNINSVKMRIEHLTSFLQEHKPDILLLQELKCETAQFPEAELSSFGYNHYVLGQKSWNGVAILSKFPADEVKYSFVGNPCEEQARFIEITCKTPIGFARVISLYAPNGGEVDGDKFELKLKFFDALSKYLESIRSFDEKLFIGGDFNIAPFDIDVHSQKELQNSTCFTHVERQKMRTILNISGLNDLYRLSHPDKKEFSWWDYRAGAFEQNKGLRIDFILASSNAITKMPECYIDYHARTKNKPSDHAPVVAVV